MAKGFTKDGKFRPTGNNGRTSSRVKSTTTGTEIRQQERKRKEKNSLRISNSRSDNRFFSDHDFVLTIKNDTTEEQIQIDVEIGDSGFKIITEREEILFNTDGEKIDDFSDEPLAQSLRISNSRSDNSFFSDHAFVLTLKNDTTEEDVNIEFEIEDNGFKVITEREELLFNIDGFQVDSLDEDDE